MRALRPLVTSTRLAALVVMFALAAPSFAGDWHYGNHIVCSDCHTQHNSANGQPMRTDNDPNPAPILLRRATPLELCLSCHDGSNPSAPDVLAPVSYVANPSAGAFPDAGGVAIDASNSVAHHLNTPSPVVPPGGTQPMVLVCTTCHDPHGNANYRNLKTDPTATNQPPTTVMAYQTTTANGANPAAVYATYDGSGAPNIIYKSGVSAWCATCHGMSAGSGHTVDRPMFGSVIASYMTWTAVTLPRVPVLSPTDNSIPSPDDQVTCLSCHKAHGSANNKGLIYADGATLDSTCQECHNQ